MRAASASRFRDVFIAVFLLGQVVVPLRYYLEGGTDERFAWRMFSSLRLARCQSTLRADGRLVEPTTVLGVTPLTHDALPRGEPDVVNAVMRFYCRRTAAQRVEYDNRCVLVDGSTPAPQHVVVDCAPGAGP